MLLTSYLVLIITSTLILYLASTPIMLGINILIMALLLSATLATSIRSWYAFLVFLIYIGGILVIFAYFLALGPNQQMPLSSNISYILITITTLTTVILLTNMITPMPIELAQGRKYLYNTRRIFILIILALILLLTIVIVVKLTLRSKGPLRPFNYV